MKRLMILVVLGGALAACNKPSPDSCRKALLNMERILGTDNLNKTGDLEGDIRRCRGGSSREAVECATNAQTKEELVRCDFYKPSEPKADGDKPADSDKPAKPADGK